MGVGLHGQPDQDAGVESNVGNAVRGRRLPLGHQLLNGGIGQQAAYVSENLDAAWIDQGGQDGQQAGGAEPGNAAPGGGAGLFEQLAQCFAGQVGASQDQTQDE